MPYADSRGVRIHYEVDGQGPPLVEGFEEAIRINTIPCLHFVGSADSGLPDVKRCVAAMPNSQLLVVPNRAHGELFRFTEPLPAIKKFLGEVHGRMQV